MTPSVCSFATNRFVAKAKKAMADKADGKVREEELPEELYICLRSAVAFKGGVVCRTCQEDCVM